MVLISALLTSCTATDRKLLVDAAASGDLSEFAKKKAEQYSNNPGAMIRDVKSIKALLDELRGKAKDKWI